jgi:predicted nucleic acid-binding Zn ribbon protein
MRRRYSQRRLQSIGEILFSVLKKRGMADKLEENALIKLWPKAVGPQIAAQTEPETLRSGTLFVKTTSSVWVQQLHFMKEDIRRKMNELAGWEAIKEIHFTVGYNGARQKARRDTTGTAKFTLRERDKRMIDECTEALADPELAAIVKRVMKEEISRRRRMEEKPDR